MWASLICYAQVYVGAHFPLDVAGGAFLGWIIGIGMAKIFEYSWESDFNLQNIMPGIKARLIMKKI